MTAKEYPKKIYLQNEDGAHPDCDTYYGEGVTWCEDKINKHDVEYIRADLVNEKVRHIAKQAVEEERLKLDGSVFMHQESNKLLMKAIDVRFDRILSRIKKLTQTNEDK